MFSAGARRWKRGRVVATLLLCSLVMAGMSGATPVGAEPAPDGATTPAFAAAAQAGPEGRQGTVEPRAIPAIAAAARAATFGVQQLARTPAFRQQVTQVARNAGLFRQVAGFFGFGAAVSASSSGVPGDAERIFDG